jgi:hypothetical protein
MKKGKLDVFSIILILSIIILILTCTTFGFYYQIKSHGFNFAPLGACLIVLSVSGILASAFNIV